VRLYTLSHDNVNPSIIFIIDPETALFYSLSLHDALPISRTAAIRSSSAVYLTEHDRRRGVERGSRDVRQRQDVASAAAADRFLRHAEHDAALLVLRDRMCTGVAHRAHAGRAVAAHAGQQHPDGLGAQCLRDGMEEHV